MMTETSDLGSLKNLPTHGENLTLLDEGRQIIGRCPNTIQFEVSQKTKPVLFNNSDEGNLRAYLAGAEKKRKGNNFESGQSQKKR